MKLFLKLFAVATSICLAFALVACARQERPRLERDVIENPVIEDVAFTKPADPIYALVIGTDDRAGTVEEGSDGHAINSGRTDTIMIVRIDPATYQISLVTVPRDTEHQFDWGLSRINLVIHGGGPEALMSEVEVLTGTHIDYYLAMNFVEFKKFVTDLGGLTADVPIAFELRDIVGGENVSLSSGIQDLDGAAALAFARMRKDYANDEDACRQIQDRQLVQSGIEKTLANPVAAAAHVDILFENMKTNWNKSELLTLILDFVANAEKVTFVSGTGPREGRNVDAAGGAWLVPRDEATWHEVMAVVDDGGDPTIVVPLPHVSGK